MEIVRDTPFEVGHRVWQVRPPTPSLTVVVKGTLTIVPGGVCTIAGEQPLCSGEVFHEDEPSHSVRLDSDFALLKPHAECLLAGTCHVPGTSPLKWTAVSFSIGSVKKTLAVYGNRHWAGPLSMSVSDPEPFQSMPLRWERSFGGPDFEWNPLGIGISEVRGADGRGRRLLPNIEDPRKLIVSSDQRPRPAGAFPIPGAWRSRARKSGTPSSAWLEKRWPFLPEDFDWSYFNAAPDDQQIEQYWRGDETIELVHLHPTLAKIETTLPGIRARCFLDLQGKTRSGFHEIPLRLDTISVDADALQVSCLWRGITEIETESLDEVGRLLVAHEVLGKRTAPARYKSLFAKKLVEAATEEDALEGEEPPPAPSAPDLLPMVTSHSMPAAAVPAVPPLEVPVEAMPPPRPAGTPDLAATGVALDLPAAVGPPESDRQSRLEGFRATALSMLASTIVDPSPPPLRRYVESTIRQGGSLANAMLAGADLSGLDLQGVDLTGAILQGARLNGVRLNRAKLDGATLAGADLTGAVLSHASIVGADLAGVIAEACELEGAVLDDSNLRNAKLRFARFASASCVGTLFDGADLEIADLQNARLDGAELRGANLQDALFANASLVNATLHAVSARRVNMDGCNLTKLRASDGACFAGGSFRKVTARRSRWEEADLTDTDFAFSVLDRTDFTAALLYRAKLSGCSLRNAMFPRAKLLQAIIVRSDLFEASFESADLSEADLRGSSLFGAQLWRARAAGARFDLANLDRTLLAGIVPEVMP